MLSMQSNLVSFLQDLGENKTATPYLSSVLGQVDKFDMMPGVLSEKVKNSRVNTAKNMFEMFGFQQTNRK